MVNLLNSTSMKNFVKFIPEKFNIASGYKEIQITTLKKCRGLEGLLGDFHEGMNVRVINPGADLSQPIELFPGQSFGGPGIGGSGVVIARGDFNCYVFCTSELEESEMTLKFAEQFKNPELDSFYYFDEKTARNLFNHIDLELRQSLTLGDFMPADQRFILENGGIAAIRLWGAGERVAYVAFRPKKERLNEPKYDINEKTGAKYVPIPSAPDPLDEYGFVSDASKENFIQSQLRKTFTKDKTRFGNNKEFRMVFIPFIRNDENKIITLLTINDHPKRIPAPTNLVFRRNA
jgi:hypothetical protein